MFRAAAAIQTSCVFLNLSQVLLFERPLVVVGGSAGALEPLRRLLSLLPGDFGLPILVVIHTRPSAGGANLCKVLQRGNVLSLCEAQDREEPRAGKVYVPPPDHHLLLQDGLMRVSHGPRENNCRPAIDPLFRSAALYSGSGSVGVLLSGTLDDGSCGLMAIRDCGGTTIVQEPREALYADMPQNAIARQLPDHVAPIAEIALLLCQLALRPWEKSPSAPAQLRQEVMLAQRGMGLREPGQDVEEIIWIDQPVPLTCPDCGGTLSQVDDHFRCHTGHAYSPEHLLVRQDKSLEEAIWAAIRVLEEKRKTLESIGLKYDKGGTFYAQRGKEWQAHADRLRELMFQIVARE